MTKLRKAAIGNVSEMRIDLPISWMPVTTRIISSAKRCLSDFLPLRDCLFHFEAIQENGRHDHHPSAYGGIGMKP